MTKQLPTSGRRFYLSIIFCSALVAMTFIAVRNNSDHSDKIQNPEISKIHRPTFSDDHFIRQIYQVKIPGVPEAYNATLIENDKGYLMAFR